MTRKRWGAPAGVLPVAALAVFAAADVAAQVLSLPPDPASADASVHRLQQRGSMVLRGPAWSHEWLVALPALVGDGDPLAGRGEVPALGLPEGLALESVVDRIPGGTWFAAQSVARLEPGLAMAASAVVPGAGQLLLGNDRWVPYVALEIWGWISFFERRTRARSLARDYRDLAWYVARRVSVGERRDTVFEYYEEMTHYAASGTWDSDPEAPGVQPELDGRTFNGDLWELSRSLFFPGGFNYQPGSAPYEQALAYYLRNAMPPTFTWAWGDSFLEQQSFRELIRRSDEAYRSSTQFLGLMLANHVVSAVDALVIGRLQGGSSESRFRIGSEFEPTAHRVPRLRIAASWRW
ncbi:MAG TPA: hypothetical protein VMM79_15400 [Longimicrobiales bacterium]|nr:hypothetical protein [Longimicrobiales bacterium]